MSNVTYYTKGIRQKTNGMERSISSIIEEIASDTHKHTITFLRGIEDKKTRQQYKSQLPYFTAAGTFSERKIDGLLHLSGYAAIDIDDVSQEFLQEIIPKLTNDPYTKAGFYSPSGNGYKLIISVFADQHSFKDIIEGYYEYLIETYGLPPEVVDISTRDIPRACYISYDPHAWIKDNPELWSTPGNGLFEQIKSNQGTVDSSRSAHEMREVCKLLYLKKSKEEIFKYMERFEKWSSQGEKYQEHTYKNAQEYVKSKPPSQKQIIDIINELEIQILCDFHIYTIREEHNPEMYIYKDGIYIPNARAYLEEHIKSKLGKYYKKNIYQQVIDKVQPSTYIDAQEFFEEENPELIAVQNGVLNIKTKELFSFDPKYRFFQKLPVTYDPSKTCETTQKHFETILYPEDIPVMQELYGYLLYRDYQFEKAFLFSGDGGNGKGKTLEQMKTLIGVDNCTAIDLKTLEEGANGFMLSFLHKRLANLGADIGKSKITETRNFKQLTGHDNITANRKHQSPIQFVNYAKMIFNANEIPPIDDKTDGFWRRWIFIRFDVAFKDKPEYIRLKTEGQLREHHRIADTEIIKRLTEPDELSGVLNWALDGLQRLFDNNGFSYNKTEAKTKEMMQKYSSTVSRFAADMLTRISDPQQYEEHDKLYLKYIEYCHNEKHNFVPESEASFKKLLQNQLSLRRVRTATAYEQRWMFVRYMEELEE